MAMPLSGTKRRCNAHGLVRGFVLLIVFLKPINPIRFAIPE
jgi:hypothetical protein